MLCLFVLVYITILGCIDYSLYFILLSYEDSKDS